MNLWKSGLQERYGYIGLSIVFGFNFWLGLIQCLQTQTADIWRFLVADVKFHPGHKFGFHLSGCSDGWGGVLLWGWGGGRLILG